MDPVGAAFLSAFLQVLFQKLASRQFLDFFKRQEPNPTIVEKLNSTLMTINAVITDAEEKEITNLSVKRWVDELKDAVYHTQDVFDEVATEVLRSQVESASYPLPIQRVLDLLNGKREALRSKLENATLRLEHLAAQIIVLGLRQIIKTEPKTKFPTTSLVDQSEVFGRDADKKEIMRCLLTDEHESDVAAIVGIGGVGKTTLAQLLYNDSQTERHFDIRAWAYVSGEFDVSKITKTIYESVTLCHCDITDLNVLQHKLQERLKRHRVLLVLDDLWIEKFDDWDLLHLPLKAAATGSRVLVTTRSLHVPSSMRSVQIHHLKPLSDGDCWMVLMRHVFGGQQVNLNRQMGIYAEEIVRKCQGLPLAAKTLGSLLRTEFEVKAWDKILRSKIWDLPPDKSNLLPVLRVSYYYLPAHLKQCFAYCSLFPKGYAFEKEAVVLWWMAEGFLQQWHGISRPEEIGQQYFNELVSRSLFQPKNGSQFIMHDLINELCQYAAGEFCFRYDGGELQGISERARHFSFLRDQHRMPVKFDTLSNTNFLRTFLPLSLSKSARSCCYDVMVGDRLLPTLSRLRVLSLSHYKIATIPSQLFEHMKHIRYLDLSRTEIDNLPSSLSRLYNLQTLILSCCCNLTRLPAGMFKLINLRYLDLIGTNLIEMPRKFGKLKSLETLTSFIVSSGRGARISELGNLVDLRGKICILELQRVEDVAEAEKASLNNKKHLKEILYRWDLSTQNPQRRAEVFEQLRPHQNVNKVTIENYNGGRLPSWLGHASFCNITFLRLSQFQNCTSLPSIGELPELQELHVEEIKGLKRIGSEFYFSRLRDGDQFQRPFKSLKILRFEDMPDWEHWDDVATSGGSFQSLRRLDLQNCPKLAGNLPARLPSFESLHIYECRSLSIRPVYTELR